jgi:hypothetical protein
MIPAGSRWDTPTKVAYAFIPLAELTKYPEGHVRYWVHGKDLAGNWGGYAYADLTLDRTPPLFVYGAGGTPAPGSTCGASPCAVNFKATDPISGGVNSPIVQAEWFIDQGAHSICEVPGPGCTAEIIAPGDPGYGAGNPVLLTSPATTLSLSFNVGPQPAGSKVVFRVRDQAGNWSQDGLVVTR